MGSIFHQLCPRYSGTLTPTAPTAIRLWDTNLKRKTFCDFLFAFLDDKTLKKLDLLLKKEFAPKGANSLFYELIRFEN